MYSHAAEAFCLEPRAHCAGLAPCVMIVSRDSVVRVVDFQLPLSTRPILLRRWWFDASVVMTAHCFPLPCHMALGLQGGRRLTPNSANTMPITAASMSALIPRSCRVAKGR
jgi:hypothetical protein